MRTKTRAAILGSSLELFARRGYSATTTDEIARKAGISKGLIFTHFRTKQDILFAIFDDYVERILPHFIRTNDRRPAQERFTSMVDMWFSLIKSEPLLVRLGLQLNLDDSYRVLIRRKRGREFFREVLGQIKKTMRELGSDRPELDAFLLMFFFDGIVANYTVAPELFPIDEIKDHFVRVLVSGWHAPDGARAPRRASRRERTVRKG